MNLTQRGWRTHNHNVLKRWKYDTHIINGIIQKGEKYKSRTLKAKERRMLQVRDGGLGGCKPAVETRWKGGETKVVTLLSRGRSRNLRIQGNRKGRETKIEVHRAGHSHGYIPELHASGREAMKYAAKHNE
jgi:hypothetical protein